MNFETVVTERDGSCYVITLTRPEKRNALSGKMVAEIGEAARCGDADPDARAVILTGSSDCFSSGADLNEAIHIQSATQAIEYSRQFHRLCEGLETLGKPVIAAIEGFCMTGGLEIALACDIRVGAAGSRYAITSARIGTVPGAGGTQRLPRLIGAARAIELLFAAEPVDAEEAYRIGLINRLVTKGRALAESKRIVKTYESCGPLSLSLIKRAVHHGLRMDLVSGLEYESSLAAAVSGTEDRREGISAFLERRQARFKGH